MKCTYTALLLTVVLLVNIPTIPSTTMDTQSYWYDPQEITLQDNAYNITDYFSLQWWYIDAVFDSNYSVHIGVMSIGAKGRLGFFLFQINLYLNGTLVEKQFQFIPVHQLDLSPDQLLIQCSNKTLLKGYLTNEETMALDVDIDINGLQVNLTFTGLTKGWKGFTGLGMWGCPLPKAEVRGTITMQGEPLNVSGTGYQEHGWDVRRLHRSWYWGKFFSDSTSVVFSQNMKNRWTEDIFVVVINSGEENYSSIAREHIVFDHVEYEFIHGRFIPARSVFQVNEGDIMVNVTFEVESIHFTSLLFLNYWRFHIHVTGVISVDNVSDVVDDFQIMEILYLP